MSRSIQSSKYNWQQFVGFRFIFVGVVVVMYFLLWRPARIFITKQVVYPQAKQIENEVSECNIAMVSGSLLVEYHYRDGLKRLQYRPQFGFFFLIAVVSLLFITLNGKPYLLLGGIHIAGSVLAYLFLLLGFSGQVWGFFVTDVISGYLVPGFSLAFVPLVMNGIIVGKDKN